MDRMTAAALLGVAIDAGRDEVQAAFRQRARSVHPDVAQQGGADLDVLTRARDALLMPVPSTPLPAAGSERSTGSGARQAGRPVRGASRAPSMAWTAMLALAALAALVIVAVVIWTVAAGTERDAEIGIDQCLIVTPDNVDAASCDQFGAQRVVSQLPTGSRCEVGTNTLVVGDLTWCLEPADAG